jgi:hypothetical protein
MSDFNPTMALMKLFKMPLTRDNYLSLEHLGAPPKEVHPEEEADMPHRFRHPIIHSNTMPEPYLTEAQKEAEKTAATEGAPADFGGPVLPNTKGIKPTLDTDNPPVATKFYKPGWGVAKTQPDMHVENPQDIGVEPTQPREQ